MVKFCKVDISPLESPIRWFKKRMRNMKETYDEKSLKDDGDADPCFRCDGTILGCEYVLPHL